MTGFFISAVDCRAQIFKVYRLLLINFLKALSALTSADKIRFTIKGWNCSYEIQKL